MMRLSIRQQVAWLTLIPLFIMAVGLETLFLYNRFADLDQSLLERGKTIARQLASSGEYGVFSNNRTFLQGIADGVARQPDVRGAVILDVSSRVLVSSGEFSAPPKSVFTDMSLAASDYLVGQNSLKQEAPGENADLLTPVRSSEQGVWVYRPIVPAQIVLDDLNNEKPPAPQKIGAVIVEMSRLGTEDAKTRILRVTVVTTLSLLGLFFYLVHLASRSITYPIRRLSKAMREIGGGDLAMRVSLQTRVDELDTLAQGLNEMAAQLQQEHTVLQQRVDEATQALRIKKEEAERASHDKSHFLAVASHDLRQPLHALGLYVAELRRKVSGTEQQHLAKRIEQSVESLSALLNALLDISKLDAGSIVPRRQICDVHAILNRVMADYQMLAGIKNTRLVIRPCNGYVISDPQLLERILMNLVSNAVRYTPQNGCVMVACRRRRSFLRIEVRDNGVGISKADQGNIFREFFQLAQPQLDNGKGLGLGLAIVDRLVKLLGLSIELRSAPGKGSVFAIEAPLAPESASPPAPTMVQVPAGTHHEVEKSPLYGKKLLIVDDDAAVLSSTAGIMASWGCQVSAADSVAQVEQFLRDGVEWDFIVSDYQLGNNTNGIDAINLVQRHQNRQVPCILISGDVSPAVLKLVSVSGHPLLHKPVRPAKLRSLIVHLLTSHRARE